MKKINGLFALITNHKYILTVLLFALIIGVVDENCLVERYKRWQVLNELRVELDGYRSRYEEDTKQLEALKDYSKLEKYAREKYFMHREDEDVYVLVD